MPFCRVCCSSEMQQGNLLEGQCELARLWLLAFVALEVGEQLAHKAADLAVGNVEGCEASDEVPSTD